MRQYFTKLRLIDQIHRFVGTRLPDGDYGTVSMVLLVLMLIISGGRRIRHLEKNIKVAVVFPIGADRKTDIVGLIAMNNEILHTKRITLTFAISCVNTPPRQC